MKSISEYKPTTTLERAVLKIIKSGLEEGYEESYFKEVATYGCSSRIVVDLIFASETTKFFIKHKGEIKQILSDILREYGLSHPIELLGNDFDKDDLLCLKDNNQNLLTWFVFEKITKNIGSQLGIEFCQGSAS